MKKFCLLVLTLLITVIFFVFIYQSFAFRFFLNDHQIIKLTLRDNFFAPVKKELTVEVVNSEASVTQGLSDREDLISQNSQKVDGLLFVFEDKSIRRFWMKDMLFNIDICWLSDGRFLSCERNAALPEISQDLTIYSSKFPANMVLETKPNLLSDQDLDSKLFFKW